VEVKLHAFLFSTHTNVRGQLQAVPTFSTEKKRYSIYWESKLAPEIVVKGKIPGNRSSATNYVIRRFTDSTITACSIALFSLANKVILRHGCERRIQERKKRGKDETNKVQGRKKGNMKVCKEERHEEDRNL
jgi:hypothetical protein